MARARREPGRSVFRLGRDTTFLPSRRAVAVGRPGPGVEAGDRWSWIATSLCAVAFCACGSSTAGPDIASNATDSDTSPSSADGAAGASSGNPAFSAGPQSSSGGDTDGAAELGCTGAWLGDDNWDTCPEQLGVGPNCDCNGYAPPGGTLASDNAETIFDVTSFLLPIPVTAGKPYAFSFVVANDGFSGDIELWGTSRTCGPGLERLYVAPIASKTYCVNVVASQTYSYVLLVQRLAVDGGASASFAASQFMACPTDRCP